MDKATTIRIKEENYIKLDDIREKMRKEQHKNFTFNDILTELLKQAI